MDYELSKLQRAAAASGDVTDVARLLAARVRAGTLDPYHVRQAAALGDPASLLIAPPAEPSDRHCNYGAARRGNEMAIGFNAVDGVLGWIHGLPALVTVCIAFVRHSSTENHVSTFHLVKRLLDLASQWCELYQRQDEHIDQLYSFWAAGESREEFYERTRVREISEHYTQELAIVEQGIRNFYELLSVLALDADGSESHVRWAAVSLAKMILDRHGSSLSAIWVAVYCRLAAGDGSLVDQQQELDWEQQYLINWLLA